jgi:hypothetical protein
MAATQENRVRKKHRPAQRWSTESGLRFGKTDRAGAFRQRKLTRRRAHSRPTPQY